MNNSYMRLIVLFDLPMNSKSEVRVYNTFRKWMIENGYIMMQFSVYSKIFSNRDSCTKHIAQLRKSVPSRGQIRIMMVTEKQYSSIEIIVGGLSNQEINTSIDGFIAL